MKPESELVDLFFFFKFSSTYLPAQCNWNNILNLVMLRFPHYRITQKVQYMKSIYNYANYKRKIEVTVKDKYKHFNVTLTRHTGIS